MKPPTQPMQRARRVAEQKVGHRDWYQISGPTQAADPTRIQIYGYIGDWWEGTDAATLARDIAAMDAEQIEVHLNSPGGLAFDGIAIYNALRQHDATVTVVVDGLAASAASIIAMAGDTVVMSLGAQMMIHDASGLCWGNAAEMRTTAEWLDKLSQSGAEIYAARAGGTADDWRQAMLAESWYTAQEAVDAGLADRVDTAAKADDPEQSFDLTVFAHAGRSKAPAPRATHQPPAEPADHPTPTTEGADMSDTLTSGLRERLGINADAELDETGLLAALDEALSEQTQPVPTAAAPAGTVLIDEGTLTELQASAALGRQAHERQVAAEREAAVQSAVDTGRIAASRADHWRQQLQADPGAAEVLSSLPENTVPMQPTGYTGGPEQSADDDVRNSDTYKNWSL